MGIVLFILTFILAGCGIESTMPADSSMQPSIEKAVFITEVTSTDSGTVVTCTLNEALLSPDLSIPMFLEHEGEMIERVILQNQPDFTFSPYQPTRAGAVVCVIEFAEAEFESDELWLEP